MIGFKRLAPPAAPVGFKRLAPLPTQRKRSPRPGEGRPTKYRSEYVEQVYRYCLLGATDVQISGFLGVSVTSLFEWREVHPEFAKATTRGRIEADALMAQSLWHRGRGYSHDAVKIFCTKDGEIIEAPYVEHYPPDTAAASLWLRNRQPDLWRDIQRKELTGRDGGAIDVNGTLEITLSPEEAYRQMVDVTPSRPQLRLVDQKKVA